MSTMINLVDTEQEFKIPAILRQAFRPFFLFGALYAAVAIALWGLVFSGKVTFTPYGNIIFWHSHEMLFGFVGAIIVGFLLTAVQNWTGLRATHGKPLLALLSVWLLARIMLFLAPPISPWWIVAFDIGFYAYAALLMGRLVVRAGNKRNLFFIPVLLLLATTNLLTHLSVLNTEPALFSWGSYSAIMLITLVMMVMGGRVIPMFTANGTGTTRVIPIPWLEKLCLISGWVLVFIYITNLPSLLPAWFMATVFAIAAVSHGYRALRWRLWVTFKVPLVWSLHFAYWFVPLGLLLFAMHFAGLPVTASTAVHGLTAGAMGSLILAMIARVSLGHSGRPLTPPAAMKLAFVMVIAGAIIRIVSGINPALLPSNGIIWAALLWALGYFIFVISYFRILTTPRADGRPG